MEFKANRGNLPRRSQNFDEKLFVDPESLYEWNYTLTFFFILSIKTIGDFNIFSGINPN